MLLLIFNNKVCYISTISVTKILHLFYHRLKLIFSLLFLTLFLLPSCIDEKIIYVAPEATNGSNQSTTTDLPGIIGIRIISNDPGTRANEDNNTPSESPMTSFNDGLEAEYRLAPDGFHFAVIYKNNEDAELPLAVLPLKFNIDDYDKILENSNHEYSSDDKTLTTKWDNVTLVANSLISNKDITDIGSISSLKAILDNNEVYVLLNFDKNEIYTDDKMISFTKDESTGEVLSKIKRTDFLTKLCLKDYKITINGKDYFTMTNTVFFKGSGDNAVKDFGYYHNTESDKVYEDSNKAQKFPAVAIYVERIATKYTVNFKPEQGKDKNGNVVSTFEEDQTNGFYKYKLKINKYTGYEFNTGQSYDQKSTGSVSTPTRDEISGSNEITSDVGYKITSEPVDATITIVGYGVSNLEQREYIIKHIENKPYFNKWNDFSDGSSNSSTYNNHRSYWTEDPNYELKKSLTKYHTNAEGYPHQFRFALETDTVNSYFTNSNSLGYKYKSYPFFDIDQETSLRYYKEIGEINNANIDSGCVLKYYPFKDLKDNFDKNIPIDTETNERVPFYALENTYYDPGMAMFNIDGKSWVWEWKRAPYSAATNFMLLCKLEMDDNSSSSNENQDSPIDALGIRTREDNSSTTDSGKHLYRGQNDIFYTALYDTEKGDHTGVITSKLGILNEVMLNGGNSGFQIFDGQWDSHIRGGKKTILDKIAWNENGFLWLGEVTDNMDEEGKKIINIRKMIDTDFTLIPAELAGGDGQCLIAPKDEIMGKRFRYYIAPQNADGTTIKMTDEKGNNLAVEISFNHLVGLIHKIIGPIDVFTNGYMYYSIPISHNESAFIESYEKVSEKTKADESWRAVGKVGVVRNNWYNITVGAISGVGTPVHSISQPIVPVMDVKRSYINLNVKLMNWHTITQDNVPMN